MTKEEIIKELKLIVKNHTHNIIESGSANKWSVIEVSDIEAIIGDEGVFYEFDDTQTKEKVENDSEVISTGRAFGMTAPSESDKVIEGKFIKITFNNSKIVTEHSGVSAIEMLGVFEIIKQNTISPNNIK